MAVGPLDISDFPLTLLMFFAGCSLALCIALSFTDDASYNDSIPLNDCRRDATSVKSRAKNRKIPCISDDWVQVNTGRCLPVELIDEIIDYLHDDKRALMACSLINHVWLPRARHHLFHTFLVKKHGKDPYKLRQYPHVARYIRRVVICGNLCTEVATSVLTDYGLVESLRLEGSKLSWNEVQWEISRPQMPRFHQLQELSLHRVYFPTLREMAATLRTFQLLSRLSIDFEDSRYSIPSAKEAGYIFHLPLQELHMRINITGTLPGNVPQLLLRSTGSSLRRLSLDILSSPSVRPLSIIKCLDLSHNVSLQTLTYHFDWYSERLPRTSLQDDRLFLVSLLSQIHTSQLHTLIFHITISAFDYNNPRWLRRFDIRFLDSLVEPGRIPSMSYEERTRLEAFSKRLSNVTMELSFSQTLDARLSRSLDDREFGKVRKAVKTQLPGLESRGIIRVVKAS